MKKYIFLMGIIMLSLIIISIEPTYGMERDNLSISSHELRDYIEENKLKNIKKICTVNFCDYLRSPNIEKAVNIFIQKYEEYLAEETDNETARSTIIKGFPITQIEVFE